MRILAIETSCDETAMAVIEARGGIKKLAPRSLGEAGPQFKVLKNIVSSQIKIHAPFGGVVPNLAKREHLKNLPVVYRKIFGNSKFEIRNSKQIDLIAVTVGPGLEPALWTGINFAKDLAEKFKKPLIGVNHLEGHLYSFLLSQKKDNGSTSSPYKLYPERSRRITKIGNCRLWRASLLAGKLEIRNLFPAISLIVSGGHTILVLMKDFLHWKKLGETRDDAAGEAYDKVAKMLGLTYPGGPVLEKLARQGRDNAIEFPRPMLNQKNYDFSFSGLKTSVFYYLKNLTKPGFVRFKADIAASFEKAVIDVLVKKTEKAVEEFQVKSIMLSGGVAANKKLRKNFSQLAKNFKIPFFVAPQKFNTDNAAMIGVAAYFAQFKKILPTIEARAHLNL